MPVENLWIRRRPPEGARLGSAGVHCHSRHDRDTPHRIRDDGYADGDRVRLEEARRDYRDRYAEARMIVPERVLEASRELTAGALQELREAEPRLSAMRRIMREDLGIFD
ncbi:hypothetical protein [Streptomyces iranensis]|uniref:hypothetical protein n=1 Tax=Streptomyces iranensis TaxID=576784 RepID=UPI0039B758D0